MRRTPDADLRGSQPRVGPAMSNRHQTYSRRMMHAGRMRYPHAHRMINPRCGAAISSSAEAVMHIINRVFTRQAYVCDRGASIILLVNPHA